MARKKLLLLVCLAGNLCCLPYLAHGMQLEVPGGHLQIHFESPFPTSENKHLRAWLSHAAWTTSLMYGDFPRQQTRVELHRSQRGSGPVPWANTLRHLEPQGVAFHINPTHTLADFMQDWTAVHEFVHLYLPYPGRRDIWMSEGFASYYQNVLMARAGTLTEAAAWKKLHDGFQRGRGFQGDETLQTLSRELRARRAFMRVYWSGAFYYLERDIRLRQQGSSLDAAIANFVRCCRDRQSNWRGGQLAESLDSASDTQLFTRGYGVYSALRSQPDHSKTFEALGIVVRAGDVTLDDTAPLAAIRRAIMAPPVGSRPVVLPAGD